MRRRTSSRSCSVASSRGATGAFTEEFSQLVVSSRVFAKGRGLEQNVKALVHHRHDVILRANVDAEVTHLIL